MRLKGVIFDLDGTLANTLPICVGGFREVFLQCAGRLYSDEEIHATFGPSEEGSFQREIPERWEEGLRLYLQTYEALHESCVAPFEGVIPVLERLQKAGYRLAIVTGKGAGSAEISLRYIGIASYFERVETGSPTGSVKANQIAAIAEEWGLSSEEVCYVGDSPSDVGCARKGGAIAVAASWAATADYERLAAMEPDANFTSVEDFANWVCKEGETV